MILGAVALYYLYKYIYGVQGIASQSIITTAIAGNTKTKPALYTIPPVYEGGEYTVTFWVYVTGFKDQAGLNKHVLEIRGVDYSTLVVGLGAHKNKLMVRVNTAGGSSLRKDFFDNYGSQQPFQEYTSAFRFVGAGYGTL